MATDAALIFLQALVVGWLVALVDAWWKLQRILLELRRDSGELLAEVGRLSAHVNGASSGQGSEIATPPQTPPLHAACSADEAGVDAP